MAEAVEEQIKVRFGKMVESCTISNAESRESLTKSAIRRPRQEQPNPVAGLHVVHDVDVHSLLEAFKGYADAVSLVLSERLPRAEHERRRVPSSLRSEGWSTRDWAASFPWP
jgi:hypothetical protein